MTTQKRLTAKRLEAMRTVLDWALAGWSDDCELESVGVDADDVAVALAWVEQEIGRREVKP